MTVISAHVKFYNYILCALCIRHFYFLSKIPSSLVVKFFCYFYKLLLGGKTDASICLSARLCQGLKQSLAHENFPLIPENGYYSMHSNKASVQWRRCEEDN